jgi:hypothetical protein
MIYHCGMFLSFLMNTNFTTEILLSWIIECIINCIYRIVLIVSGHDIIGRPVVLIVGKRFSDSTIDTDKVSVLLLHHSRNWKVPLQPLQIFSPFFVKHGGEKKER